MKVLKILGFIGVTLVLLYLFVANFSSIESRFECPGQMTTSYDKYPITVYFKLEEYRWWVGLWSESDASIYMEIPNRLVDYYSYVKEVGDQYQIIDSSQGIIGNFSTLSKVLTIKLPLKDQNYFFDSTCKRID